MLNNSSYGFQLEDKDKTQNGKDLVDGRHLTMLSAYIMTALSKRKRIRLV